MKKQDGLSDERINNIVLVHGAFADGSGWEGVYKILTKKGYNVSVVANPNTSLADDVAATNRVLARQNGPVILVGHSYGGAVITEAGNDKSVVGLVYVAAFAPDVNESTADLLKVAPSAPENGILPPDEKGFVYYDKQKFHAGFAADVSKEKANFMYASQGPIAAQSFTTVLTQSAWKIKPSYAIVATKDKSINPVIQHKMYERSNTKITEVKGSHVIFMSQPQAVAKVIVEAAQNVSSK